MIKVIKTDQKSIWCLIFSAYVDIVNIKIFGPHCFLETKIVIVQIFIKIFNKIKNNRLNKLCHVHNSKKEMPNI